MRSANWVELAELAGIAPPTGSARGASTAADTGPGGAEPFTSPAATGAGADGGAATPGGVGASTPGGVGTITSRADSQLYRKWLEVNDAWLEERAKV